MEEKQKHCRTMLGMGAVLMGIYLILLFMNHFTPLLADDFYYHTNIATNGMPLQRLRDVAESMRYQYLYLNGRVIPHTVLLFLNLTVGKPVFNLLNAAVFTVCTYLIYRLGNMGRPHSVPRLMFSAMLMFVFLPAFGQTALWMDGAINYLWGLTLILLMLYFFQERLLEPAKYHSPGFFALSLPLAFLAGGWSENASAVLLMLMVLFGVLYFWKFRKLPAFYCADFVVATVSWLLMITAPANSRRRMLLGEEGGFLTMLPQRLRDCTAMFCRYLPLILLLAALFLLILCARRYPQNRFLAWLGAAPDRLRTALTALWLLGALTANFVMVAAPYNLRSALGMVLFLLVAVNLAASCLRPPRMEWLARGGGVLAVACVGVLVLSGMRSVRQYGLVMWECERQILTQREQGEDELTVDAVFSDSQFVAGAGLELLQSDPEHYVNRGMAQYYQTGPIFVGDVIYLRRGRIESARDLILEFCAELIP